MKKLPDDNTFRQAILVDRRMRSRLRARPARGNKLSSQDSLAKILGRVPFELPQSCTFFTDQIDECLSNFSDLRSLLGSGQLVLLDFSKTRQITALYAVYLFSELEYLLARFGSRSLRINIQSLTPNLRFAIRESGILALVNGDSSHIGMRRMLPILHGQQDEGINLIIDFIIGVAVDEGHLQGDPVEMAEAESRTFRAIQEAMLNVDYHAYENPSDEKKWWFTACILNSELHIAICDRGIGIPCTLPRRGWWEHAKGVISRLGIADDDAQMIKAAMQYTRSSAYSEDGRGLGTKDMQNLILSEKKGRLTIISGNGHYVLEGRDGGESTFNFSGPIDGTAISWKIPLGKLNE